MYFSNACEGLQEIYTELEQFTGTSDDKHDDIVSALSLLTDQFGAYIDMGSRIDNVNTQYATNQQATEIHNMVHCLGKYSKLNAASNMGDHPNTVFQTERSSGFGVSDSYIDPLADLV
jgi:hypothetical protein